MTDHEIIHLQRKIGTTPDGVWGPKSREACQQYLRAMMPKPNPSPDREQAALRQFYGQPGHDVNLTHIDVSGLGVRFDGRTVRTIQCHRRAAASLLSIVRELSTFAAGIKALGEYAGCFNFRPIRGGTSWSLHAFGAAVDLSPATNGNHTPWPQQADMPIEVMEVFARHGWLPAGAFWGRDAMHFQMTK